METDSLSNLRPKPFVLLMIDSFGIAPLHEGNAFSDIKLPHFFSLIKNYPLALLNAKGENIKDRYFALGAKGRLLDLISEHNLSFSIITETEKILETSYYLNGASSIKSILSNLQIIPSILGQRTRDPEQVADKIRSLALDNIRHQRYDVLFVNLSNLDLVSVQGDIKAAREAALIIDDYLHDLVKATLKQNGVILVSSAYGRAEAVINMSTGLVNNGITDNPVPFIIIGDTYKGKTIGLADPLNDDLSLLSAAGNLDDISPTILSILNLPIPEDLFGKSLI